MNRYLTSDLLLTSDGDLALGSDDLAVVSENDLLSQMVLNVIRTNDPDWFGETIGANLEQYIGAENSRENGEHIKNAVLNGLMATEFFEADDLWAEVKPSSLEAITVLLFVRSPFSTDPLVFRIDLDLALGASIERIDL